MLCILVGMAERDCCQGTGCFLAYMHLVDVRSTSVINGCWGDRVQMARGLSMVVGRHCVELAASWLYKFECMRMKGRQLD